MISWKLDIERGVALIIVPPFASTTMPSLAAHVLQACALKRSYRVRVFYANLVFAAEIGQINYEAVSRAPIQHLLGERLFCSAAYGLPPFGNDDFLRRLEGAHLSVNNNNIHVELKASDLSSWERAARPWTDRTAEAIVSRGFPVVGCTTTFEQTAASIALLNRIKCLSPDTVTVLGGANCEGEMAEGIASLESSVDYVFSGESEAAFPEFIQQLVEGTRPERKIVRGAPCVNLEDIPVPDYLEFFAQRQRWLVETELSDERNLWVPYESSRGCWWGRKRHCTFCGLNGETIAYRQKSADQVISDVQALVSASSAKRVCMTDNIMPYDYFKTFLHRTQHEVPGVTFFYELKANLSLHDVLLLKRGGVKRAQPGIESLSSACLQLMNKGVNARQNINLLRYARAVSLWLGWNILYALPGDKLVEYRRMLKTVPLLRHLQPPLGLSHLSLERFSPYFVDRARHGIDNLRPIGAYYAVFPANADIASLAYHFEADYASESKRDRELMKELEIQIEDWRQAWQSDDDLPTLALSELSDDCYILLDTRGLTGTQQLHLINKRQARLILVGGPDSAEDLQWAFEQKLAIELDGRFVPLATAQPTLFQRFLDEFCIHKEDFELKNGSGFCLP